MSKLHQQISEFSLEGRFLGFNIKDGDKFKHLRISTAQGEFSIKISKQLRSCLDYSIKAGEWVKVTGKKKLDLDTGKIKFKAYSFIKCLPNAATKVDRAIEIKPDITPAIKSEKSDIKPTSPPVKNKACILVCQKSDCWKRGGKDVCQVLTDTLRDRGLDEEITVKTTGCLKQCKNGPNIVVMPDKTHYRKIAASAIPAVVDKHFSPVALV